jgi:hypothetical protein
LTLTLVVLAAGMSSRYGGLKQLAPVGPSGESLMDYAVYDAVRSGCTKLVFVIRREIEAELREHVNALVGDSVSVAFTYQAIESAERRKPWGTAHAVLAAESHVSAPFIVCNADDFYGPSAYEVLASHLGRHRQPGNDGGWKSGREGGQEQMPYGLVGYRLRDTLSPFGGVSRAVCECDGDGYLTRLVEVKRIEEVDSQLTGVTDAGEDVQLDGGETVSMNIWGFTPGVFQALRRQFESFVATSPDADAEFLLSTAVNEQVARGETRLRVMQARDQWFGMTFTNDRPLVMERIRRLVDRGTYPRDLPGWFRQLP